MSRIIEFADGFETQTAPTSEGTPAANIAFSPAGSIAATTVQAALVEVDADVTAHVGDATAAHAASAISNIPVGNLAATTVQAALDELQTQVDTLVAIPTGVSIAYNGRTAPNGWLMEYGQAVSRSTYSALYAVVCPSLGNFTVTIATPAVVTLASHELQTGERIRLSTTGALPTGLTANTDYYVIRVSSDTFNLATTVANAIASTAIATSGTQSGTHSAQFFAYGAGDGSTTFNIPDSRGRVDAGADAMGGTAAGTIQTIGVAGTATGKGAALGNIGGASDHVLTSNEMPSHTHTSAKKLTGTTLASTNDTYDLPAQNGSATVAWVSSATGGGVSHSNLQPTLIRNKIIKT